MFFFLSKVLIFLVSPMVWFFALFILALKTKDERKKKKLLITAIALIYICANSFVVDELARAWEPVTPDYYLTSEKYDLAIILGGVGSIDERQNRINFGAGGDRLFQTLELYHRGRVKQILFTGGSGSIRYPTHKEGTYIKKYLSTIHVPDSALLIENDSKNTYENAIFSKKILDSLKFSGSVLLVTSAYHMPRALATFKKAGYTNVTPYLTNRMSGPRRFDWDHCLLPNAEALSSLNVLIHEWIGYVVYKMRGYA